MSFVFPPAPPVALPVMGSDALFPVRRVYCVGQNYSDHVAEMGGDSREPPFFFSKPADALVPGGGDVAYPPKTENYHHEVELVVAIGKAGFRIPAEQAHEYIYGYACGLDMTRRDLQLVARDKGRPWDLGKDVEQSSVASEVVPMPGKVIESGVIELSVNGTVKQQSNVDKLIWNIRDDGVPWVARCAPTTARPTRAWCRPRLRWLPSARVRRFWSAHR